MANKAKKDSLNIEAVFNNDIMGSNNSSETNIIDNTRIRVFSEGLPAYETDKRANLFDSLDWRMMVSRGNWHDTQKKLVNVM
jgi:hypothetical protein